VEVFERPDLDGSLLAKGMGVHGTHVSSLDAFGKVLLGKLQSEGPTLIELLLWSRAARRR
jgi:thiamine pyrophosphate-dependent acetolactate synthase large subunit-like protein